MIECYIDDSSDERHEKFFACGAVVGNHDQWNLFEVYWGHETHGLKKPFHATDCEGGFDQFKSWPKAGGATLGWVE